MKNLIIYFSRKDENWFDGSIRNIDKGNTEIVAENVRELTNGDLFKVEPINPYPYNYKECCEKAKEELYNNERPELKNYLNNIDNYDTIYILSPVWWGHIAMPLYSLLEKLDFKGKVVKPIVTHEGSGLGNIMEDINKLCVGADIKNGLAIYGTHSKDSLNKLKEYV